VPELALSIEYLTVVAQKAVTLLRSVRCFGSNAEPAENAIAGGLHQKLLKCDWMKRRCGMRIVVVRGVVIRLGNDAREVELSDDEQE